MSMKKLENKIKILFVYYSFSSFVRNDLKILQKHFNLKKLQWHGKKDIIRIAIEVFKSDITYTWFAEDYSAVTIFFSKLFKKKSIVVVGGRDVANVPELNYGQFTLSWYKKMLTIFALKYADLVFPVSNFTKNEMLEKVKIKHFILIYNGVDIKKFFPRGKKQNNLVITVGLISWQNLKRKGIETFVKSAIYAPKIYFVVIGKFIDNSLHYLKSIAPPNVEFTGFVSDDEMIRWYQKAKVICQLSYYEAFGLALAEGMACGCIPVVTKERAGLPEFVGDAGFYVPYGDEKATADAIKKALNASHKLSKKSKKRIIEMFSIEGREKKLIQIINKLIKNKLKKMNFIIN